jgi:hypothetical protein
MRNVKAFVLALSIFLPATSQLSSARPVAIDNGTALNPAGSPHIGRMYTLNKNLVITWNTDKAYTHFNVRWNHVGGDERQFEVDSSPAAIRNYQSGEEYHIRVQGCTKPIIGSSHCSSWGERYYTPN